MTIGQSIKEKRTKCGLTQNDLADQLNVSFQTISKWENDINEPDLGTVKQLAKIFNCSIDDLLAGDEESEAEQIVEEQKPEDVVSTTPKAVATCADCKKELFEDDMRYSIQRKTNSGLVENLYLCENCKQKHAALNKEKENPSTPVKASRIKPGKKNAFDKKFDRPDKTLIIWSIVASVAALAIALTICILNYESVGIGWTIGIPLIAAYCIFADVYCIFSASWVSEVFMAVASWSVRFPGIIFSFDLDGLMFLIVMKILFFILGVLIGIAAFLLALALSTVFSIFTLIPLIIYNANHYEGF